MIDERTEAQASLYVLGALPPEETAEFEAALRSNLQLQLLVKELQGTAGAMVAAFPQVPPPPALKQRVLRAIEAGEQAGADVLPADGRITAWMGWVPWVLAACFAILCVILISVGQSIRNYAGGLREELGERNEQIGELRNQIDSLQARVEHQTTNYHDRVLELQKQVVQRLEDLHRQNAALTNRFQQERADVQRQLATYRQQVQDLGREKKMLEEALAGVTVGNKDTFANARLAVIRPTADGPAAVIGASVYSGQEQRGLLVLENLPPLPPSQSYQLWLFDPKLRVPVNGGVLPSTASGSVRLQFSPELRVESVERFAITVEPAGGAPTPTGKMVLAGN